MGKLPQSAVYQNVHGLVGATSRNEILAAIEGMLESLPQSCIQLRAYTLLCSDDVLSLVSIVSSFVGVAVGLYFGYKACNRSGQVTHENWMAGNRAESVSLKSGSVAALAGIELDPSTADAVVWMISAQDIQVWIANGTRLNDVAL